MTKTEDQSSSDKNIELKEAVDRIQVIMHELGFSKKRMAKIGKFRVDTFNNILRWEQVTLHRDTFEKLIAFSKLSPQQVCDLAGAGIKGYQPYCTFNPCQNTEHKEAVNRIATAMDELDFSRHRMSILSGISKETFSDMLEGRKIHFRPEIIEKFITFSKLDSQKLIKIAEDKIGGNQPFLSETTKEELINRVKGRMNNLGVSNFEMARRVGIDPYALSQILAGKRTPSAPTIKKLEAIVEKEI